MNILLNFVPLKSGGGVQVGMDFINNIGLYGYNHNWHLVASKGTPFAKMDLPENCKLSLLVEQNIFSRLYFELVKARKLVNTIKPDIIYTQFGPHWPSVKGTHVVGCAYSNLFYPEVDFWRGYSFAYRLKRRAYDFARLRRLRKADSIIFETKDLAKRAIEIRSFPSKKIHYVLPSVSSNVSISAKHEPTRKICEDIPDGFNICLISGYAKNKNIENLVKAAEVIKDEYAREDIRFILTLPRDNVETKNVMQLADNLGVSHQIINIGPVPYEGCSEVYRKCDAAILPATLESFSNNIAEAWAMEKPLLISDMDWSRSLCEDGAIYIDQNNPSNIAMNIVKLVEQGAIKVVRNGIIQLSKYPTSGERFGRYLKIIIQAATEK